MGIQRSHYICNTNLSNMSAVPTEDGAVVSEIVKSKSVEKTAPVEVGVEGSEIVELKMVEKTAPTEVGAEGLEFVKPKVVEKIFTLPVVTDTYDSLANLSTPLHPYLEKAGSLASPVAVNLMAGIESMAPEVIQTGYSSAKGQVVAAAASVDASLCSGVDSLVEKVPVLKQATPALYKSTKEGVTSYATLAATYIASFTLAQLFLKASDVGLETADSLLKWTSNEKVEPIMMGLRRVRSDVSTVRKEGVIQNGTEKAKMLEEASLLWAVVEIVGLANIYNYFVPNEEEETVEPVQTRSRKNGVKAGSK